MSRKKTKGTAPVGLRFLKNRIGAEERQDITAEAKQQEKSQEQQDERDYLLPPSGFWLWVA